MQRKYYEAYDDRYRQVHKENLKWFEKEQSPIVETVAAKYAIEPEHKLLEIGCGEGRDAAYLLRRGYDLLATDVSDEAISFCREQFPAFAERFQKLDCITESLSQKYDFIYAVAVIHMLVLDEDRDGFYSFIRQHLAETGIALICTMGDGREERQTDIKTAFNLQRRLHEASGKMLDIASTSCRMVSFDTFRKELKRNGLFILEEGISQDVPGFSEMMYAVVKKA